MPTEPRPSRQGQDSCVGQPRRSLRDCPVCRNGESVPAGLSHCDYCHRDVPDGLTKNIASTYSVRGGRMKSICDFCVETN